MSRVDELSTLAREIVEILRPACTRIDIAGALRRQGRTSNDVDIVLEPRTEDLLDLWGDVVGTVTMRFDARLDRLIESRELVVVKRGPRMVQLIDRTLDASVDLFSVLPPQQFGALLAIRTGPADFARMCVTSRLQGGAMPPGMRQEDGALWRAGAIVPTDTEEEWFEALGLPCWPPARRSAEGLRMYLDREVVRS